MSGPIVRTGTTPKYWQNWDNVFAGSAAAKKPKAGKKGKADSVVAKAEKAVVKAEKAVAKVAKKAVGAVKSVAAKVTGEDEPAPKAAAKQAPKKAAAKGAKAPAAKKGK